MAERERTPDFERDLASFHERLRGLRQDQHPSGSGATDAFAQLELAAETLRAMHAEFRARDSELAERYAAGDRDRQTMRSVFRDLPVPAVLLDIDGRIRRLNQRFSDLLGVSGDYATGKAIAAFLDVSNRSAVRSLISGVARDGVPASIDSLLIRPAAPALTRLSFSRLQLATDPAPLVVAVAQPPEGARPAVCAGEREPEPKTVHALARRADLMLELTAILLDELGGSEAATVQRVGRLLCSAVADWVLVDLRRDGATTRALVCGPAGERADRLSQALERGPVDSSTVPNAVIESGSTVLHSYLDDPELLGRDERNVPFLSALGANSLLSVPVTDGSSVLGAITMVRRASPFGLTDQATLEDIAGLLGRGLLSYRRWAPHPTAESTYAYGFLPGSLPSVPGIDIAWFHRSGDDGGELAPYLDLVNRWNGLGLSLGSTVGSNAPARAGTVRHWSRLLASSTGDPASVLQQLDDGLRRLHPGEPSIAAAVLELRPTDGGQAARLASAGHRSSITVRVDGRIQRTDGGGTPLNDGVPPTVHEDVTVLQPGDLLLLYTNELPEVTNSAGETFYGSGELSDVLARVAGRSARAQIDAVTAALTTFADQGIAQDVLAAAIRVDPRRPAAEQAASA